jgi:hypothetical protein
MRSGKPRLDTGAPSTKTATTEASYAHSTSPVDNFAIAGAA